MSSSEVVFGQLHAPLPGSPSCRLGTARLRPAADRAARHHRAGRHARGAAPRQPAAGLRAAAPAPGRAQLRRRTTLGRRSRSTRSAPRSPSSRGEQLRAPAGPHTRPMRCAACRASRSAAGRPRQPHAGAHPRRRGQSHAGADRRRRGQQPDRRRVRLLQPVGRRHRAHRGASAGRRAASTAPSAVGGVINIITKRRQGSADARPCAAEGGASRRTRRSLGQISGGNDKRMGRARRRTGARPTASTSRLVGSEDDGSRIESFALRGGVALPGTSAVDCTLRRATSTPTATASAAFRPAASPRPVRRSTDAPFVGDTLPARSATCAATLATRSSKSWIAQAPATARSRAPMRDVFDPPAQEHDRDQLKYGYSRRPIASTRRPARRSKHSVTRPGRAAQRDASSSRPHVADRAARERDRTRLRRRVCAASTSTRCS